MGSSYWRWLHHVEANEAPRFGKEPALLSKAYLSGVPLLPGLVLAKEAQASFWQAAPLKKALKPFLSQIRLNATQELPTLAEEVRAVVLATPMPAASYKLLTEVWDELATLLLRAKTTSAVPVSLRIGETYLSGKVSSAAELADLYQKLLSYAFIDDVLFERIYQRDVLVPDAEPCVIQFAPGGQVSGIAQQYDPESRDASVIYIQARHGADVHAQEVAIVDEYRLDRRHYSMLARDLGKHWWARDSHGIHHSPAHFGAAVAVLTDEQAAKLARLTASVQQQFEDPVTVEWVYARRQFWIAGMALVDESAANVPQPAGLTPLFRGKVLHLGFAHGPVVHIANAGQAKRLTGEEIVVAPRLSTSLLAAIQGRCAGLITEAGSQALRGQLRAIQLPTLVGVQGAAKQLRSGQMLTLDCLHGAVYAGVQPDAFHTPPSQQWFAPQSVTEISVVVDDPISLRDDIAEQVSGSLLVRGEFILPLIKLHPEQVLTQKREQEYAKILEDHLQDIYETNPGHLLYQYHDLHSSRLLGLKPRGQDRHEPNPTIGKRGLHHLLESPELFRLDTQVVKRMLKREVPLGIVLPMARSLDEVHRAMALLAQELGGDLAATEVWVRCETPALLLELQGIAGPGITGVIFDVPALAELLLGFDRENYSVAHHADQANHVVLEALTHGVAVCTEASVATAVLAEGSWLRPEVLEAALGAGAQQVFVSQTQAEEIEGLLCSIEQQLVLRGSR